MPKKLTTAKYRSLGWAAYEDKRFKQAAQYYQAAINAYPKNSSGSEYAKADINKLREMRDRCKEFAKKK